ncbi:hypothetical protein M3Y98_00256300 [Aphelenchoides besseyi]|nr:hypothetical protein M3Y98_00256300 [Aphelenchoides besseyi]
MTSSIDRINSWLQDRNELHGQIEISSKDSCCRRSLISDCESMIQDLWSEGGYTPISDLILSNNPQLIKLSDSILKPLESIHFCREKIWFGGTTTKEEVDHSAENSLFYLNTCLMLWTSGLCTKNDILLTHLIDQLVKRFKTRSELLNCLMENDERLLHFITGLFELSKTETLPDLLQPLPLSVMLMWKIGLSETTFLDWLCSEVVSIAFLMRFSKFLRQRSKNEITKLFELLRNEIHESHRILNETTVINNQPTESFRFTIFEIHGDDKLKNEYVVPSQQHSPILFSANTTVDFNLVDLLAFFDRLKNKLKSLQAKKLLHFNASALIRLLESINTLQNT